MEGGGSRLGRQESALLSLSLSLKLSLNTGHSTVSGLAARRPRDLCAWLLPRGPRVRPTFWVLRSPRPQETNLPQF